MADVDSWTCEQVACWLDDIGLGKYKETLCAEHKIDGKTLLSLTEWDLRQPPLSMSVLGDIKTLGKCINQLKAASDPAMENRHLIKYTMATENGQNGNIIGLSSNHSVIPMDLDSGSTDADDESGYCLLPPAEKQQRHPKPDIIRCVLAVAYGALGMFTQSIAVVYVNDKVPDQKQYPVLPDMFLDSIPYIPWGFKACEKVIGFLIFFSLSITFCHKYRLILVRRYFALAGTLYFLRAATMIVTILPACSTAIVCSGKTDGLLSSRIKKAFEIWFAMGLSSNGVATCGDYIFSGHAVTATLLNFFINEYSSRDKFLCLHIGAWAANILVLFFILASRQHYTVDVLIAFVLASRLFTYYHTLASNRSLKSRDRTRWKISYPVFWFFESKTHGVVPNVFEWPCIGLDLGLLQFNQVKTRLSKYMNFGS